MVTLDGMAKDALLGSSMMGNSRFLFHREEIEKLLSDETIYNGYQGQISYIDLRMRQAYRRLLRLFHRLRASCFPAHVR